MVGYYKWYEEPDGVNIVLIEGYLSALTLRAIAKAGSIVKLSHEIGISKSTIDNYKNERGATIKGIKLILSFLDIAPNRINHKIKSLSWNKDLPKFRFNSEKLAIILAASLADGHISQTHFMYKNTNNELIQRVELYVREIFGKQICINHKVARNGVPYILCPAIVKRQLVKLGSPQGKKLFLNPGVPQIITQGSLKIKKSFIQQFFDDEGWPEKENRKVACCQGSDTTNTIPKFFIEQMALNQNVTIGKIPAKIKTKIVKPRILVDIRKILINDFNIYTAINLKRITKRYNNHFRKEYISATWELSCIRRKDVYSFYKKIGFYSTKKQKLLKEIAENNSKIQNEIKLDMLNAIIKVHKNKGVFRVKDLQNSLNLDRGRIRKRLTTFVRWGILLNTKGVYTLRLDI